MTSPIFIVSSGRSGTAMMDRLLGAFPQVEMHHEYMVHHLQPAACRYAMGLCDADEVRQVLRRTHGAAVAYCRRPLWGDSSNKLSWIVPILAEEFPGARFVHLMRDGRKVSSSYFHKLAQECYDGEAVAAFRDYALNAERIVPPPPEKRYWWPLPMPGDVDFEAFAGFDQFQRIAWHWVRVNEAILSGFETLAPERRLSVRLEDLASDPMETARFLSFLGLPAAHAAFETLQRPHNVNRPEDKLLTEDQTRKFWALAEKMMRRLGYADRPEYAMTYGQRAG